MMPHNGWFTDEVVSEAGSNAIEWLPTRDELPAEDRDDEPYKETTQRNGNAIFATERWTWELGVFTSDEEGARMIFNNAFGFIVRQDIFESKVDRDKSGEYKNEKSAVHAGGAEHWVAIRKLKEYMHPVSRRFHTKSWYRRMGQAVPKDTEKRTRMWWIDSMKSEPYPISEKSFWDGVTKARIKRDGGILAFCYGDCNAGRVVVEEKLMGGVGTLHQINNEFRYIAELLDQKDFSEIVVGKRGEDIKKELGLEEVPGEWTPPGEG